MARLIKNIISVLTSIFRVCFIKVVHPRSFSSFLIQRISPSVELSFSGHSKVKLGRMIRLHSRTIIKANGGNLSIQDGVKMNTGCIVNCRDEIVIGAGSEFGPGVLIYDHDHNHDYKTGKNNGYKTGKVIIGKNCWIGANCIILKDTVIGDNCVVAAGSVIKGNYPGGSLIVQKRKTECTILTKE